MIEIAWTTPRTWVTGEVPTASNFNTHLRDNLNYLNGAFPLGDPAAAWTAGTPTVAQSGAVSLSTATFSYIRVGRLVIARIRCVASGAGGAAAAIVVTGTGLPAAAASYDPDASPIGVFVFNDGGVFYHGYVVTVTPATPTFSGVTSGAGNYMGAAGPSATIASGDEIGLTVTYESAA